MSSAVRPRRSSAALQRPRRAERAQAGGGDRRVQAVGEAARVGQHAAHRQPERERDVAAHDELRSAALGLDEAGAADVVGARGLVRREAHRVEVVAGRGRAHVGEADHPLGREVVEAAGEHGQRACRSRSCRRRPRARRPRSRTRRPGGSSGRRSRRRSGRRGPRRRCRATPGCGRSGAARPAGGRAAAAAATPSRPSRRPACWPPALGWTWPSSSSGVRPASVKASTVQARFTSAIRSAVAIRSLGMPKRARSSPVGSWPATRRVCATTRGTRICVPAFWVTLKRSPTLRISASANARASSSVATSKREVALERHRGEHGVPGGVDRPVALQRAHADPCGDGVRVALGEPRLGDLLAAASRRPSGRGSARARSRRGR